MQRFKKILCYVGGPADCAAGLDEAAELAARNGAALTVLDVLPESLIGSWLTLPGQPELERMVTTSRLQDLAELVAPIEARGVEVRAAVTTGSPFVEIIRRVVNDGHDLVIKTAQGLESRLGGLLGSTALHLMRKCPAPVWVVKPSSGTSFDRVLAAVDPALDNSVRQELSLKVAELAVSLAKTRNSQLHLLHAWWLPSEAMLRGRRINMPPAKVDRLLRETRAAAEKALDNLLEKVDLSSVKHEVHLVKGIPFEVIGHFASHSDVTVMGTVSRTGVAGLLIGNTAESVLRSINGSVLTIKPRGFQTPLNF